MPFCCVEVSNTVLQAVHEWCGMVQRYSEEVCTLLHRRMQSQPKQYHIMHGRARPPNDGDALPHDSDDAPPNVGDDALSNHLHAHDNCHAHAP